MDFDTVFVCVIPFLSLFPFLSGKGTLQWSNGDIYEGDFKEGFREGLGKLVEASGRTYEGSWVRSLRQGEGKEVWPNGDQVWVSTLSFSLFRGLLLL